MIKSLVLAVVVLFSMASMAVAQELHSIDLTEIAESFVAVAAAVLSVIGPLLIYFVIRWVSKKTKISEETLNDLLGTRLSEIAVKGIQNGAAKLTEGLESRKLTVDVKSAILAHATNYMIEMAPETLQKAGLTREKAVEFVRSRMETVLASSTLTPTIDASDAPAAVESLETKP